MGQIALKATAWAKSNVDVEHLGVLDVCDDK